MFPLLFKEMKSRYKRYLLVIIAIAWGTFTISSLLSVGEGLRTAFADALGLQNGSLMYMFPTSTTKHRFGGGKGKAIKLNNDDFNMVKNLFPNEIKTIAYKKFSANLFYHGKQVISYNKAITPTLFEILNIKVTSKSRKINEADIQSKNRVIVIGHKLAEQLFPKAIDPLGKTVLLGNLSFKIIGVLDKNIVPLRVNGDPQLSTYIPLSTYQALSNDNNLSTFIFATTNVKLMPMIQSQTLKILSTRKNFSVDDKKALFFLKIYKFQSKTNMLAVGLEMFLGLLGVITLLIAGIGVANVIFINIRLDRKLIGLQFALGAKTSHILSQYLLQGLMMVFAGGLIGYALSYFGMLVLKTELLSHHIKLLHLQVLPVFSNLIILIIFLILTLIVVLSSFWPARKASLIEPAVALHDE